MDKLLVAVEVPSVEQIFDITVPDTLSAAMLIELLDQLLGELENGGHVPSGNEVLCCRETGVLLYPDKTLQENNIRMGDHLILY